MSASDRGVQQLIDGKYALGEVLRTSPSAVVHRAEHAGIKRFVEVKTLPQFMAAAGPEAARLLQEARIVGSIAHRNVQGVVDSSEDDAGRPFVVYEALNGPCLADILAEHPEGIGAERAVGLIAQLLEALSAVHLAGVVHRAISPEAIWVLPVLGGGELVKLSGFDQALVLGAAPSEPLSRALGGFAAPELRGPGEVGPAADIFSAGLLLRAVLTGSIAPGRPLSDTARRAVEQATSPRPEERFADAELFIDALSLLARFSGRPPRDSQPIPSDSLVAGVQYLDARRQSRTSVPPPPTGQAAVHLLPVLMTIEAICKDLGDDVWARLVSEIPEAETLLPGAGNTDAHRAAGVPVDMFTRILATVDEIAGRGDLRIVTDLGKSLASRGVGRIAKGLRNRSVIRPDDVVDEFASIWARFTLQGEVKVIERGEGTARVAVRGQVQPSLELCALTAGFLRGVLDETEAKGPEVCTTACQALGDRACVYAIDWK